MVEVFKTNVKEEAQANKLIEVLSDFFPNNRITFDLEDCDNILRISGDNLCVETIIFCVSSNGFECTVLT